MMNHRKISSWISRVSSNWPWIESNKSLNYIAESRTFVLDIMEMSPFILSPKILKYLQSLKFDKHSVSHWSKCCKSHYYHYRHANNRQWIFLHDVTNTVTASVTRACQWFRRQSRQKFLITMFLYFHSFDTFL